MNRSNFQFGIDQISKVAALLNGKDFGLLMNQASVNSELEYSCDILSRLFPGRLQALFSPQHGLWGEQQANMIESNHSVHSRLSIPVYSLYHKTRWPTEQMLQDLDCLVIDLQDVGTRVYTFIWTISYCLEACAKQNIEVIILDRPNPLGGTVVEGPILDPAYASFVGRFPIPMRHGLTIAEFACWANQSFSAGAAIQSVSMQGWHRDTLWPALKRPWIPPSPNVPKFESVLVYPGQVLLEGTNLSEGRGTTQPFLCVGAPFLDGEWLLENLSLEMTKGLRLVPIRFVPMFDKWVDQSCGGVAIYVDQPPLVRSFEFTTSLIRTTNELYPDHFEWLPPPYEYETKKMPIDILYGSDTFRQSIDSRRQVEECHSSAWWNQVTPFLLYGSTDSNAKY